MNHVLLDGRIIINTRRTSAPGRAVRRQADLQVSYQADQIDPRTRSGWSVLVTGTAAGLLLRHRAHDPILLRIAGSDQDRRVPVGDAVPADRPDCRVDQAAVTAAADHE